MKTIQFICKTVLLLLKGLKKKLYKNCKLLFLMLVEIENIDS